MLCMLWRKLNLRYIQRSHDFLQLMFFGVLYNGLTSICLSSKLNSSHLVGIHLLFGKNLHENITIILRFMNLQDFGSFIFVVFGRKYFWTFKNANSRGDVPNALERKSKYVRDSNPCHAIRRYFSWKRIRNDPKLNLFTCMNGTAISVHNNQCPTCIPRSASTNQSSQYQTT